MQRGRYDIMASILAPLRKHNGLLKTDLMYYANLNSYQVRVYLKEMADAGLIMKRTEGWGKPYEITDTGAAALKAYDELRALMEPTVRKA